MSLVSAHGDQVLLPQHLPMDLRIRLMRRSVAGRVETGHQAAEADTGERLQAPMPWREHRAELLDKAEREYFSALLRQVDGDAAQAARLSGLKSARLYELLSKHALLKANRRHSRIPGFPE